MILSPRGIQRLSAEEWDGRNGLKPDGRFYVYNDYKGFPTIGIGHLVRAGEDWSKGLDSGEVLALFHADLAPTYDAIERWVTFPLNQAEFDSICITVHNCGTGFLNPAQCTAIRLLNANDVEGYCTHMLDWNKSAGKYDPGLYARRQREAAWFKEPPEETPTPHATLFDLTDLARIDN